MSTQVERLTTIWLELLELANFASQHKQDFETIIQPLVNLLLTAKTGQTQRRNQQAQHRTGANNFAGFEIPDDTFQQLLSHVKLHLPTIKQWLQNAPSTVDEQQHYATLWTLVFDGRLRERLLVDVQPTCCLLYTSPSPRDRQKSRMPSSA